MLAKLSDDSIREMALAFVAVYQSPLWSSLPRTGKAWLAYGAAVRRTAASATAGRPFTASALRRSLVSPAASSRTGGGKDRGIAADSGDDQGQVPSSSRYLKKPRRDRSTSRYRDSDSDSDSGVHRGSQPVNVSGRDDHDPDDSESSDSDNDDHDRQAQAGRRRHRDGRRRVRLGRRGSSAAAGPRPDDAAGKDRDQRHEDPSRSSDSEDEDAGRDPDNEYMAALRQSLSQPAAPGA
jgi:hypothetical protein